MFKRDLKYEYEMLRLVRRLQRNAELALEDDNFKAASFHWNQMGLAAGRFNAYLEEMALFLVNREP